MKMVKTVIEDKYKSACMEDNHLSILAQRSNQFMKLFHVQETSFDVLYIKNLYNPWTGYRTAVKTFNYKPIRNMNI